MLELLEQIKNTLHAYLESWSVQERSGEKMALYCATCGEICNSEGHYYPKGYDGKGYNHKPNIVSSHTPKGRKFLPVEKAVRGIEMVDWSCRKCGKNTYELYGIEDEDCVLHYKCLGCGEEKKLTFEMGD